MERVNNSFLRLFCYCHFFIRQDRSRWAGLQKHLFQAPSSQRRSSVPSSTLLCAGNLVNIRSKQELSWIPLFHERGRRTPSFWVTGTTHFESVDITCQIWLKENYELAYRLSRSLEQAKQGEVSKLIFENDAIRNRISDYFDKRRISQRKPNKQTSHE